MKKAVASKMKPTLVVEVKDDKVAVTRKGLMKDSVVSLALGVPTAVEENDHKVMVRVITLLKMHPGIHQF